MRTKLFKMTLTAGLALAFALTFSCSTSENEDEKQEASSSSGDVSGGSISSNSGNESSSSPGDIQAAASLRAKPVPAVPQGSKPDVLYSWTDGDKNYYIINAGYIENSLLMENGFHYSGVGHVGISTTETSENSITENRTNSVSNSIVVSKGLTVSETNTIGLREAITTGVKTSTEVGGQTSGISTLFVKGSVKAGVEASVEGTVEHSSEFSSTISRSLEESIGKTTETSESFGTTIRQSWSTSTSLAANTGDPAGYYRYAWYVTSDVYFVVSTSLNNQELLSWEVASIPREKYELRQEYSQTAFDNSPVKGSEIVFADDFYKTLPKPTNFEKPEAREPVIEAKEFNAGNHTYTFDKGFPATVEIYALGAGGGGQGGHYKENMIGVPNENGTGGSGGGGAAAYMKFNLTEQTPININVGSGGNGGGTASGVWTETQWKSGYQGENGGDSKVTLTLSGTNTTLTVGGGKGGGGSGNNQDGGAGGVASLNNRVGILNESLNNPGKPGMAGSQKDCTYSYGGNAGTVDGYGYLAEKNEKFGGGSGGGAGCASSSPGLGGGGGGGYNNNNSGQRGGDGKVIIIITY